MTDPATGSYQFGPYRLNAAKRLLTRNDEPVPLPPKAFDLLLLLVESDGRALTKNELIDALWPGTFVEEANLTFQISTLRKTLGDPAAGWIETIPKHGYRFTGPVGPRESPEPPFLRRRARPIRWWAAAVLAVAIASGGLLVSRRSTQRENPPTATPLTAYPGMELHPSLSPDGNQVAFAWDGPNEDNFDIYLKLVGPGEPMRLTSHPAPEFSPSWSPDGRSIAFLRSTLSGEAGVYVIPALGGAVERKIIDLVQPLTQAVNRTLLPNANLAWTPDGKWLATIGAHRREEATATTLWLVSVENGHIRQLTEPPRGWLGDFGPAFSPGGRTLAFVRFQALSSSELHVLSLLDDFGPAGPSRRITVKSWAMEAPVWMPDSRRLIFSSGPPLGMRRLNRVSATEGASQPEVLTVGEDALTVSMAPRGRIVYSRLLQDANIWLLDLDRPRAVPRRLIASTRDDYGPDYSPDGKRIVFASTRSGATEIWLANTDGSNPTQLTKAEGPLTSNPRWSPDGAAIVFDSRVAGVPQLYLLNPSTGQMRRLTDQPWNELEPRWSRDGRWIYFGSGRTGQREVWKAPLAAGNAVQVTRSGGIVAQESADGRYIYFSRGSPVSLWRAPAAGGTEVKIADGLTAGYNFEVVERGVYFVAERGPQRTACIRFYDSSTGRVTELVDTGRPWGWGISVSPDRRRLLYSVVDARGSDLMVADGIR